MKKTIQKFLAIVACCYGLTLQAQNVPINLEAGGNGATWGWAPFENSTNPPILVVANPNATGINASANCLQMTALIAGNPWAGFESQHPGSTVPAPSNLGAFTLSSSNAIVKIMVYKSVISDVGIKFANATNGSTGEIKVANTVINQWEELTFNFSSKIGEPTSTNIDQIIFFPDFQARTTDNICYIDNVTFNAVTVPTGPMIAAPTPTAMAANVVSLYSDAYVNVPMATWATSWSAATLSNILLPNTAAGALINNTLKYDALNFVGAEPSGTVNAGAMNTFNVDIWTPNITAFRVKLVDFGANGIYAGGDDVEHELSFTPTLSGWNSYHIPLSNFINLTTKSNIGQIIFSGDPSGSGTAYIDNVYFSFEAPIVPMIAAPTPTALPANVVSLYSDAYTNVSMATWATVWSAATLNNVLLPNTVAGALVNNTLKYDALNFVGAEPNATINASTMNTFNVDVWTPNMTAFRVKLVDYGANAIYAGGDDVEHELSFTPTLSGWNSYHIPLADFINLTTKAAIGQIIFSGNPSGTGIAYVDNVYFSIETAAPMIAAPTPTALPANVVSLYSDAYTNVAMATWATVWSQASLANVTLPDVLAGPSTNNTLKYEALNFVGAEPNTTVDASAMNTFNIDVWTPNMTTFRVKLVDFGANGTFGGGDDVEHELSFTPTLSGWNTYHIPLADFVNLTTKAAIGQIIFSGNPSGTGIAYVDNVYFSFEAPIVPMIAAPTPTALPGDVVSLYSDAYTNASMATWATVWSQAMLTNITLPNTPTGASVNNTLKYDALNFVGAEPNGTVNASAMNTFNVDVWTPNMTAFRVKLVDFGANGTFGGGDDVEHELSFTPTLSGWNTLQIPLSNFVNLTTKANIGQIIFSGNPSGSGIAYVDNVYFSNNVPLGLNLISFEGSINNTTAILNWNSIKEANLTSYEIEKGNDGISFDKVGSVVAQNAINAKYTFNDELVNATTYYRLKVLETDGKYTYSNVISLNLALGNAINVYPNPANDFVVVTGKNILDRILVINTFGSIVLQEVAKSNFYKLNISNLPVGTYFIQVKNKAPQQFIKQ